MGKIIESGVVVNEGDVVTLTTDELIGSTIDALPVQNQNLPVLVKPGDFILIDDGLIQLSVLSTTTQTVQCRVVVGATLRATKG